jgi:hypothetical protein
VMYQVQGERGLRGTQRRQQRPQQMWVAVCGGSCCRQVRLQVRLLLV